MSDGQTYVMPKGRTGCAWALIVGCLLCNASASARDGLLRVVVQDEGGDQIIRELLDEYSAECAPDTVTVSTTGGRAAVNAFADGSADVLMQLHRLQNGERLLMEWHDKGLSGSLCAEVLGERRFIVLAGPTRGPLREADLGDAIGRTGMEGPGGRPLRILFPERQAESLREFLARRLLTVSGHDGFPAVRYEMGPHCVALGTLDECIRAVSSDPRGTLAITAWAPGLKLQPGRAGIVPIARSDGVPAVHPDLRPTMQEGYPLSERIVLIRRADCTPEAERLRSFALSERGGSILAEQGFITPHDQYVWRGEQRLLKVKAAKAPRIRIAESGIPDGTLRALAHQYTKARSPASSACVSLRDEDSAGRLFLRSREGAADASDAMDLLLIRHPMDINALAMRGDRQMQLDCAEHVLPGRAAAIVVHSTNKLDDLTLDQVRAAFAARARDWKILAAGAGDVRQAVPIHPYGLKRPGPAADVFYERVLPVHKCGPIHRKEDTAAVLRAVSGDPQAIAFVDGAALPEDADGDGVLDGTSVKLLAVRPEGIRSDPVPLDSRTVASGAYPVSSRLYLYVHPDASEAAKDFARFIATGGHSAANPYVDVPAQVSKVFRDHGLMPPPKPQKAAAGGRTRAQEQ